MSVGQPQSTDNLMHAASPSPVRTAGASPDEMPAPGHEIGGLRRFSALDGIRALAVLAVLCYHAGISWMGGGLLGVDVFFVLSGFLITTLLCREMARTTTIQLGRFWADRARRLLPALIVLILGVAVYAYVLRHSIDVAAVRGDALSTLLYVANWHFILSDQGYFIQAAAPSPLLHTWSLAVEEQFYLIWPLVALFVVRRRGVRALAVTAGLGAIASAALMLWLYHAGFSVNRLYYGTDTRAQALMVGAFLGAVGSHFGDGFSIVPTGWTSTRIRRWLWTGLGVTGALYLAWAWHALAGQDPFLYRGGFFAVALATGAVIVGCVTVPASLLTRLLSLRVLVFVGRISYGLYLYHWPLFLAINHAHTGLSGVSLLVARLAVTFAAATISFLLIEEPIRTGKFFRGRAGLGVAAATGLVTALVVLVATVVPATAAVRVNNGLSSGERRSLTQAGAFTRHPVKFMLVGDSLALTLAVGLRDQSVSRYGVSMINRETLGCDLDSLDTIVSGAEGTPESSCRYWKTLWPQYVTQAKPDVVGLLIGRWDIVDRVDHGKIVHIGEPAWNRHLYDEIDQAVHIFSTQGAKVVLITMPYLDPPQEAPNGSPYPENEPVRVNEFNQILTEVTQRNKRVVTLIDLNKQLDPHGYFQGVIDGVTVRASDGIHITAAGGEWLQPYIFPTVAALGLADRAQRP